jgi:hypothetical protein
VHPGCSKPELKAAGRINPDHTSLYTPPSADPFFFGVFFFDPKKNIGSGRVWVVFDDPSASAYQNFPKRTRQN